jgi:hypothetical protein
MTAKKEGSPSETIVKNLEDKGWKIVENVEATEFEVKDLELVSVLKDGEESVEGDEMRRRAVSLMANLGLDDAMYIFDHQAEIPPEFRGKYILFPGTLFDCQHIPSMWWEDGKWLFGFIPVIIGLKFFEDDFLVRCKNTRHGKA